MEAEYHRMSRIGQFTLLVVMLVAILGAYTTGRAATIAELQADHKDCLKSRTNLEEQMKAKYKLLEELEAICRERLKRMQNSAHEHSQEFRNADAALKEKESECARLGREYDSIRLKKGADITIAWNRWAKCESERRALVKSLVSISMGQEIPMQLDSGRDLRVCVDERDEARSAYISLWPVWQSTDTECAVLEAKIKTARQQQQPPQFKGKRRIFMVGNEPKEVGNQVCYQAEVVADPGATPQTRYGYYWYLNGTPTIHGYSSAYTFQAPRRGVNTIMVRVVKTGDGGRTWEAVAEGSDKFYVQGGSTPAIGENRATVTLGLRDGKTNQSVSGWIDFGGKDYSKGGTSFAYRSVPFGNVVVRAGAEGYEQKTVNLTINQNPYSATIALDKIHRSEPLSGWAGVWLQTGGTVTITGSGNAIDATYEYRNPPSRGKGSWKGCQIQGNTATCSLTEEYEDEEKWVSRKGTVKATLNGDTISGVFHEDQEPSFRWKPGAVPWKSSIQKGKEYAFTLSRKR